LQRKISNDIYLIMNVGIIHTVGSQCRCADAIAEGLRSLGHRPFIYDSESIELMVGEIADTCSLVIDHSDTYLGKGSLRAMVRLLMEAHGVKLIGSDSRACFLCDDKAAARAKLIDAGIPVPPGIVITGADWEAPSWLTPPLIIKPVYSHMSRSIAFVDTIDDAKKISREMFTHLREPVLVESYIAGRELAISVIEGIEGLQALTPFEWLPATEIAYQTEQFKAVEQKAGRNDCRPAELSEEAKDIVSQQARLAFQTLGMCHYGRFDIRFSSGGTFYFLEANTTPSFEPAEAFALSANWSGFSYEALLEHLITYASTQHRIDNRGKDEIIRIELPGGPITFASSPGGPQAL
jgi:D-alanine-D-alanine ligase